MQQGSVVCDLTIFIFALSSSVTPCGRGAVTLMLSSLLMAMIEPSTDFKAVLYGVLLNKNDNGN
jgi:hypothetical protein